MKISVIVPIYNVENYLEKCIQSLLDQDLDEYEIILVNDGSPDNSQAIIDKYVEMYPNKIIGYKKENGGQGSARNLGVAKAKGEYILFVDSDDYVEKNMLKKCYDNIKENNFDILVFDYCELKEQEKTHKTSMPEISENMKINYLLSEPSPCNKLFKKSLWIDNNLKFQENVIYEDLGLIPTIVKYAENIGYLKEDLYNYVIRKDTSMKQLKYTEKLQNIFYIMSILDTALEKEFKDELEYIYIVHLLHGAGLRFLKFDEGKKDIEKIATIMKEKFPRWAKNKYLKSKGFKYKMVCNLLYHKQIKVLKKIIA